MGEVFFTADSHFGHKGVIRLAGRPFGSVEEMEEGLIERWNAVVAPGDLVYHLGDFCFKGSKAAAKVLERLNGDIVLIRGNHDSKNSLKLERWRAVHDLLEITLQKQRIALCHYPLLEWPGAWKGALHLHGHTHGQVPPHSRRADVGADVWAFRPVTLEQILARLEGASPYDPEHAYMEARALSEQPE